MTTLKKKCPKCSRTFPATLEYFYKHKSYADGLYNTCKLCIKQQRIAQFPVKEKTCIICGKVWKCTPASDGRYRETCSGKCLKTYRSHLMKGLWDTGHFNPDHVTRFIKHTRPDSLTQPIHSYEELNSSFNPFS